MSRFVYYGHSHWHHDHGHHPSHSHHSWHHSHHHKKHAHDDHKRDDDDAGNGDGNNNGANNGGNNDGGNGGNNGGGGGGTEANPLVSIDLKGPVDTGIKVGGVDPGDALIEVDANLPEHPGLELPGLVGHGEGKNPLAFVDLKGPVKGDVLLGGGEDTDPATALITAKVDLSDVGLANDLSCLPMDIGGIGDLLDFDISS